MAVAFKCDLCGEYCDEVTRYELKRGDVTQYGPDQGTLEACVADVCDECVKDTDQVELKTIFHKLRTKGFNVVNNNPQTNIAVPQHAVPPGAMAR